MKRQSYKIKHDFLFDSDDDSVDIPKLHMTASEVNKINLSDALNAKDENSFMKLIDANKPNVVIKDDIGSCINPVSERYKQFIIRCVCRKLIKHNFNVYF